MKHLVRTLIEGYRNINICYLSVPGTRGAVKVNVQELLLSPLNSGSTVGEHRYNADNLCTLLSIHCGTVLLRKESLPFFDRRRLGRFGYRTR